MPIIIVSKIYTKKFLEPQPKYMYVKIRVLSNTGESVQKWTRIFSTRRWVIFVARTRRKKKKKILPSTFGQIHLWTSFESSPVSVNRHRTERKTSLQNRSGQICPFSLLVTFQRELLNLHVDEYIFLKMKWVSKSEIWIYKTIYLVKMLRIFYGQFFFKVLFFRRYFMVKPEII